MLHGCIRYRLRILIPVCFLLILACRHRDTMFDLVDSSHSHIDFNNRITESDSINPFDMEFLYNGGGVAIGDFNNDGRPDIYFTASQVSNRLYLNEGGLVFNDITTAARVSGEGRWCNAASVVDINNDGWKDIYVCTSINRDPAQRANLLYINQGLQANGLPLFKEMAKEYNLADTGYSVHAPFFDYDNDGDLDMYLLNTKLAERNGTRFDEASTRITEHSVINCIAMMALASGEACLCLPMYLPKPGSAMRGSGSGWQSPISTRMAGKIFMLQTIFSAAISSTSTRKTEPFPIRLLFA